MCRGELDTEEIGCIIWDKWGLHIEAFWVHVDTLHKSSNTIHTTRHKLQRRGLALIEQQNEGENTTDPLLPYLNN